MSPALPVVSGNQVVGVLEKVGYLVVRQRGSHVRMIDDLNPEHRPVTVPMHKEVDRGLLRAIIRDADLSVEEFIKML
ncbi:MAG: type II toxin-antitoxin system HicA family toxin [Nitrospirae bacterium]|nr:type II toxin-antitoxin system HicA family toxin [Nitrospirota bacterium]